MAAVLAAQINDEVTHLQGLRLERGLGQLRTDILDELAALREEAALVQRTLTSAIGVGTQHDYAARDRLDHVSASAATPARLAVASPAALLRADRQVVGFIDRPELTALRQWCDADAARSLMLLTGAGGVGKTRLALQLAKERDELGWISGLCDPVRKPPRFKPRER